MHESKSRRAGALERRWIGRVVRRVGGWHGTLVLNYHRIGVAADASVDRALWSASDGQLERQLRFLARNFELIGPDELLAGDPAPRARRVLVTFDDGYRDLYTHAFPVLEATGVRATLFLCTGFIDGRASGWWDEIAWMLRSSQAPALRPGRWSPEALSLSPAEITASIKRVNCAYRTLGPGATEDFLRALGSATGAGRRPAQPADWITWDMAREMHAAGHAIGAHSISHSLLSRLPAARQREEISGSLDRIEAEIGERTRWFSYPVGVPGAFTAQTVACVREAGVELAFSQYGGYVAGKLRPLDVPRTGVAPTLDGVRFAALLVAPQLAARRAARARARATQLTDRPSESNRGASAVAGA
jgi:peptidoglycan/xylan/chitin deacetylase (PgdA/CDA1 family)